MKIAVLGSGAMGMLFGALLHEGGNNVTMVCRREQQAELIQNQGIWITTDAAGRRNVPVTACLPSDISYDVDLIIVFTKSHQSEEALASIADVLSGCCATLMSLQNGLGNERPLIQHASMSRVIVGNTFMNSNRLSDNEIVSHGKGETAMMTLESAGEDRLVECVLTFEASGLDCVSGQNAARAMWRKVCFNSAMSPVTALLRLNNGGVVQAGARDLVLAIAHESVCVADALGVAVDYDEVKQMLETCWDSHRDHVGSMCADCLAGRETDIEYLNGEIARRAILVGMHAPYNTLLAEMVRALTTAQQVDCRLDEMLSCSQVASV